MNHKYIQRIIDSVTTQNYNEVDIILKNFFKDILDDYNFSHIDNHVYSRSSDIKYDEDCKVVHMLTRGFNYRLRSNIGSQNINLPEQIHDAPNSLLLQYVSKPILLHDILLYLHSYIYGLSNQVNERYVTATQFLKFEQMLKLWDIQLVN